MATTNDFFKNLAKEAQARAEKEDKNRGQGGFDFDPILWSAFEGTGETKIIRFIDVMIPQKKEDYDIVDADGNKIFDNTAPKEVHKMEIYGDDHKKFHVYVPSKNEDPSHFVWRLLDIVLAKDWVADPNNPKSDKKVPLYKHQKAHGELVDRFLTNGFNFGISKNKFDKGWKPQTMLLANVIDREQMKAHKEHNHTFLLSKNVNEWEGNKFYETGVPSYGFVKPVLDTISYYGALNSYDVVVTRVGSMDMPWKVRNAVKYTEEVPENLQKYVTSLDHLTDEELAFERYDLTSMFKHTSYRKWFKHIKVLLKQVDTIFNTHFHDEVEAKAKEEKEEWDAKKAESESSEKKVVQGTDVSQKAKSQRTRTRREEPKTQETNTESEGVTWEVLENLGYKGKKFFTQEVQAQIESLTDSGEIVWKSGNGELIPCTEECCYLGEEKRGMETPENDEIFKGCIYCGFEF